jgi:sigma-B regulation protein RsbU (phosphoserine phosphatase)
MTLLRSLARQGYTPEDILRHLNDELLEQNPRSMFVTLQCLVFDLANNSVTCASAGHHAAIRMLPFQAPRFAFTSPGRVLGLMPADDLHCETLQLHPGDTYVLFTDGVTEAFDVNEQLFGEERLIAQLQRSAGQTARDITLGVVDAVRRYAAGAQQSDDLTVVAVRYAGPA